MQVDRLEQLHKTNLTHPQVALVRRLLFFEDADLSVVLGFCKLSLVEGAAQKVAV